MKVNITIPTYNRADLVEKAIKAALTQSYDCSVTVVDDGSIDDTWDRLKRMREPRLSCIRLARNAGTAQAKNVSLLLSSYGVITFHDSDDIPTHDKIERQVAALEKLHRTDPMVNWQNVNILPDEDRHADVCLHGHRLISVDGKKTRIVNRISLVDDFFPNLQWPNRCPGDWTLINSGLFRRSVFERLGGYCDLVEEDRELRNRMISAGMLFYYIEDCLLDKFESADSLTVDATTNYISPRRCHDREIVWQRLGNYDPIALDFDEIEIAEIINPANLTINPIPATEVTIKKAKDALAAATH